MLAMAGDWAWVAKANHRGTETQSKEWACLWLCCSGGGSLFLRGDAVGRADWLPWGPASVARWEAGSRATIGTFEGSIAEVFRTSAR
jgi:hypothetical protein